MLRNDHPRRTALRRSPRPSSTPFSPERLAGGHRLPAIRDLAEDPQGQPGHRRRGVSPAPRRGLGCGHGRRGTALRPQAHAESLPPTIGRRDRAALDRSRDRQSRPGASSVAGPGASKQSIPTPVSTADRSSCRRSSRLRQASSRPTASPTVPSPSPAAASTPSSVCCANTLAPATTSRSRIRRFPRSSICSRRSVSCRHRSRSTMRGRGRSRSSALWDRECRRSCCHSRAQNPTGAAISEKRASDLRRILRHRPQRAADRDRRRGGGVGCSARDAHARSRALGGRPVHVEVARAGSARRRDDGRRDHDRAVAAATGRQRAVGESPAAAPDAGALVGSVERPPACAERRRSTPNGATRLIDALAAHDIQAHGRSGFNVWIPVREETATVQALADRGWAVAAGERFRLQSPPAIRVTTSALLPAEATRFAADLAAAVRPRAIGACVEAIEERLLRNLDERRHGFEHPQQLR